MVNSVFEQVFYNRDLMLQVVPCLKWTEACKTFRVCSKIGTNLERAAGQPLYVDCIERFACEIIGPHCKTSFDLNFKELTFKTLPLTRNDWKLLYKNIQPETKRIESQDRTQLCWDPILQSGGSDLCWYHLENV